MVARMLALNALLLTLMLTDNGIAAEEASAQPGREAIREAWKAIESQSPRIKVAWIEKADWRRGGIQPRSEQFELEELPAADVSTTQQFTLSLAGDSIRFERDGQNPETTVASPAPERLHGVEGFDGAENRHYFTTQPMGAIHGSLRTNPLDYIGAIPLHLAIRPLQWLKSNSSESATFDVLEVDDEKIVMSITREGCLALRDVVTVDPRMGMRVTRMERFYAGKLSSSYVIQYIKDGALGWRPSQWGGTLVDAHNQSIKVSYLAVVKSLDRSPQFAKDEFRPEFPVGARVTDHIRNKRYIVLAGSAERLITPEELKRRPTYQEIITTESGQAGLDRLQTEIKQAKKPE